MSDSNTPYLNVFSRLLGDPKVKLFVAFYLSMFSLASLFLLVSLSNKEIQEVMVFVAGISFFYAIALFMDALGGNAPSSEGVSGVPSSRPNIFVNEGGFYVAGDLVQSMQKVDNINQRQQMTVPENYFRVIKSIEVLPESLEDDKPSGKDILVRLQAYVEADPNLSVEEKYGILEQIKNLADAIGSPEANKKNSVLKNMQALQASVKALPTLSNNVANLVSSLSSFFF